MKRASYRHAVEWIALNDAAADGCDESEIRGYISTKLVADIFDVTDSRVAVDVARVRYEHTRRRKNDDDDRCTSTHEGLRCHGPKGHTGGHAAFKGLNGPVAQQQLLRWSA